MVGLFSGAISLLVAGSVYIITMISKDLHSGKTQNIAGWNGWTRIESMYLLLKMVGFPLLC